MVNVFTSSCIKSTLAVSLICPIQFHFQVEAEEKLREIWLGIQAMEIEKLEK